MSKRDAKVCVRVAGAGRRKTVETVRTWGATTNQVLALRDHLVAEQVSLVVMEATSDYWKPFYYLLEDAGFELMLVNARHVKNMPGRKTDVTDAAWLAQLGAHGLVRASFVPPAPIRELRDLTRARVMLTRERGREIQRLEKLLEDARIKLSSVATDITGVSGRLMLQALIDGHRDPAALADLAKRRLRTKIPELTEALTGRFTEHHALLAGIFLETIDQRTRQIDELNQRIDQAMTPFRAFCDLICTIPGVGRRTAEVVVAETGADMTVFPSPKHLASWAGVCPGSNESAGRVKSTRTRPGNPYLKAALGTAALSIAASHGTFLAAKYRRLAARRGGKKALVAIEHTLLTAIWSMGSTGAEYDDPGPDYYIRHNPERVLRNATRQLERLGYSVTLSPTTQTA
ncbi:MAG TPA: IS110 family transposase [Propionibacteriaceae bacterium]